MPLIETETLNVSETKTRTTTYTPLILKSTTGGSCHKYTFCHNKHVFVVTKHIFCHDKSMLAATKLLSQQNSVCCDNIFLLQQDFCDDKHTFVMTKDVFCRDKSKLVTTKLCMSRQIFVATIFLLQQKCLS